MKQNNVVPLRRRELQPDEGARALHTRMREMLVEHSLHEKEGKALFDEQEFARRFGVTWARRDREALVDFQRELHLSDRQIRWLNRSNSLRWREGRIEVICPRWVFWGGIFIIVALWIMLGSPLLAAAYSHGDDWAVMTKVTIGFVALYLMSRCAWLYYVFPFKVRKQAAARQPSQKDCDY